MSFDGDPALRSTWWVPDDLDWIDSVRVRGMRVNDDIVESDEIKPQNRTTCRNDIRISQKPDKM